MAPEKLILYLAFFQAKFIRTKETLTKLFSLNKLATVLFCKRRMMKRPGNTS